MKREFIVFFIGNLIYSVKFEKANIDYQSPGRAPENILEVWMPLLPFCTVFLNSYLELIRMQRLLPSVLVLLQKSKKGHKSKPDTQYFFMINSLIKFW